ncbi:class F sortase [Rhodococcus globerulus]|uniref:class F sortase n=1 Tax=Rhodococcus globerulus TaxID=33008 RepID=UPI000AAB1709|nr:class F sortase [Rhodococcus globerulus]
MTSMNPNPVPDERGTSSAEPVRRRKSRVFATAAIIIAVTVGLLMTYLGTRSGESAAIPPAPTARQSAPAVLAPADAQMSPATLSLDPLGVQAPIVDASVIDGALTPPDDVSEVGIWLDGAPLDSQTGTTLIAGHVNLAGQGNGALFDLGTVEPGQEIRTSDAAGNSTRWRVTAVVSRAKADGIEESVLAGPDGPRKLAVVTCGGELEFSDGVGNYQDNVYLYADVI